MLFPQYEKHDEPSFDLIDETRQFLAEDLTARPLSPISARSLAQPAELIANHFRDRDSEPTRLAVAQVALSATIAQNPEEAYVPDLRNARLAAHIFSERTPAATELLPLTMHSVAIDTMSRAEHQYRRAVNVDKGEASSRFLGQMAHYTILSLLTRLGHPRLLAMSALPHHDYGNLRSRNFDVLLAESSPWDSTGTSHQPDDTTPVFRVHKIQVKHGCLSYCEESRQLADCADEKYGHTAIDEAASRMKRQRLARQDYDEDITLISGCCDAQATQPTDANNTSTMALLRLEYANQATQEEVRQLDTLSNGLLMAITGDPRRKGMYQSTA